MRQRAFYFSDEKKLWQECLQEDFCQKEIQELPAFLICVRPAWAHSNG